MTEEPVHLVIEGSRGTLCGLHGLRGDQKAVMYRTFDELREWMEETTYCDVVCEDCEGRLALHELAETDLEGDSDLPTYGDVLTSNGKTVNEVRAWMGLGPVAELEDIL